MTLNFKTQNVKLLLIITVLMTTLGFAQSNAEKWKLQLALGLNNPIDTGENVGYYTKYINFPTINLGVQHMFSESLGAKLDVGFNRSSNANTSLEFKLNYTRINAQLVYDLRPILLFLPNRIAVVAHAGPGISFTQPLGDFSKNKYTYFNALAGAEIHYGLSRSLSVYTDLGYAYSLAGKNKYDVAVDGFSFNDDLMYVAVGISISLNGCQYCN
tara:strand:- start:19906 stop:20547 length:642 start_codon:yes stop_codon:yes gene_type:complete